MVVVADPIAGTVTIRLGTPTLVGRCLLAAVVGAGAPLLADRFAPSLLVVALLVTAGAAAWVVVGIGATAVLDDHGITLGVSRRGRHRVRVRLGLGL